VPQWSATGVRTARSFAPIENAPVQLCTEQIRTPLKSSPPPTLSATLEMMSEPIPSQKTKNSRMPTFSPVLLLDHDCPPPSLSSQHLAIVCQLRPLSGCALEQTTDCDKGEGIARLSLNERIEAVLGRIPSPSVADIDWKSPGQSEVS
jgi:hypothetical protein